MGRNSSGETSANDLTGIGIQCAGLVSFTGTISICHTMIYCMDTGKALEEIAEF